MGRFVRMRVLRGVGGSDAKRARCHPNDPMSVRFQLGLGLDAKCMWTSIMSLSMSDLVY